MAVDPDILAAAFTPGREIPTHLGPRDVLAVESSIARFPTGRIVACDPFCGIDAKPFALSVPPGDYEVALSIVDQSRMGRRTALACLWVSKEPIVSLVPADPPTFAVDQAAGCILDASQAATILRLSEEQADECSNRIFNTVGESPGLSADVPVSPFSEGSIFVFNAGLGDGSYSSYYGRDRNGQLAAFVLDFDIVGYPASTERPPKPWWRFW